MINQTAQDESGATGTVIPEKDYHTVMAHFYRGELGRIMIWRQRLDVTTNWAIMGCAGLITFGLGSDPSSHLVFPLANLLALLLLYVESRRYRYYDAFRSRVRMLEAHFLMPVVMRDARLLAGDWKRVLSEDLLLPTFKLGKWTAIRRRYRRNYVWIFLLIQLAWLAKLWTGAPKPRSLESIAQSALFALDVPQWLSLGTFTFILVALTALTISSFLMKDQSGEFSPKPMRRKKWVI